MPYRDPKTGELYPSKEYYDAVQKVKAAGLVVTTTNVKKALAGEPLVPTKKEPKTEKRTDKTSDIVERLKTDKNFYIALFKRYGLVTPFNYSIAESSWERRDIEQMKWMAGQYIKEGSPKIQPIEKPKLSKEELETRIEETKKQLEQKQQLLEAAKAQGLKGEDEIPDALIATITGLKEALGSPDEDERAAALAEAEKYYGYTIPEDYSPYKYPEKLQEIIDEAKTARTRQEEDLTYNLDQINAEKKRLLEEYNQYLEDIRTGKLRVGEDYQIQEARRLEQKKEFLEQQAFQAEQGLEALQRGWIARGGLYAGPRREAVSRYQTGLEMEKERYLSGLAYTQKTAKTAYERQLEDYLTKQKRAGTAYGFGTEELARRTGRYEQLKARGIKDIALGEIQKKRSLQEYFQEAIAKRMARTLGEQYI